MSDAPGIMIQRPHLSLLDRGLTACAWVFAGALFLTVGWFAMEPDDPLGPVTLLARRGALAMLIQAMALAGVAAGLATAIAGRRLADVGTFAAALGLAAVSLRGGTVECLLVESAGPSGLGYRWLALEFALEATGWLAVVAVTIIVSALVMHWCFRHPDDHNPSPSDVASVAARALAGFDVPRLSTRWFAIRVSQQTSNADGVRHTLVASGVALAAMALLSAGLSSRSIQHGQVCFVVAAGVSAGTYVAYRIVPVRSALWSILAVGVIAIAGYLWVVVRPSVVGLPPNIPPSHFARILPLQFISVGTAAALAMFWYVYVPILDRDRQGGNTRDVDRKRSPRARG